MMLTSTHDLIALVTVSWTAASVASPRSVKRWMKICHRSACLTHVADGVSIDWPFSVGICSASTEAHSPSVQASRRFNIRRLDVSSVRTGSTGHLHWQRLGDPAAHALQEVIKVQTAVFQERSSKATDGTIYCFAPQYGRQVYGWNG